jgi:hypothetical protein
MVKIKKRFIVCQVFFLIISYFCLNYFFAASNFSPPNPLGRIDAGCSRDAGPPYPARPGLELLISVRGAIPGEGVAAAGGGVARAPMAPASCRRRRTRLFCAFLRSYDPGPGSSRRRQKRVCKNPGWPVGGRSRRIGGAPSGRRFFCGRKALAYPAG